MPREKSISVSYRVSARFKRLLEAAALREKRSQTNLLEVLLERHCEREGIVDISLDTQPNNKKVGS